MGLELGWWIGVIVWTIMTNRRFGGTGRKDVDWMLLVFSHSCTCTSFDWSELSRILPKIVTRNCLTRMSPARWLAIPLRNDLAHWCNTEMNMHLGNLHPDDDTQLFLGYKMPANAPSRLFAVASSVATMHGLENKCGCVSALRVSQLA